MDNQLYQIAGQLRRAQSPEEVFGQIEDNNGNGRRGQMEQAKAVYRRLAWLTHPDRYHDGVDRAIALDAFKALQHWWQVAQVKLNDGSYGVTPATTGTPVIVRVDRRQYVVEETLDRGEICQLYLCTPAAGQKRSVVFKVAIDPQDNDLVVHEAEVIRYLRSDPGQARLHAYLPECHDTFVYQDSKSTLRQVNVLAYLDGFYSLKEVRTEYPTGVDPKDMAWIWRRLLTAIGLAHVNQVIHGAVLPDHILIHPQWHGLVLVDWSYAVVLSEESGIGWPGECIRTISLPYRAWYPPEVNQPQPPTPGFDLYMAARCMVDLLGGDPLTGEIPTTTPKPLQNFFRGCLLPVPQSRPQDAWELLAEFDDLIERLWGKRTFRPFVMPQKPPAGSF